MKVGDITKRGEITIINYELDFVQFCEPGTSGVYGCFSMTFEELDREHGLKRNYKNIKGSPKKRAG